MNTATSSEPLTADDMRLIAQIGFLAARENQQAPARSIFRALRVARPDSVLPFIGLAVAEIRAGHHAEAARLLRDEALPLHPDSGEIGAFLGLALVEGGRSDEARRVLQRVVESDTAPAAEPHVRMARKLLDMVHPAKGRAGRPI
jgi:predicted Zn-dependent protease